MSFDGFTADKRLILIATLPKRRGISDQMKIDLINRVEAFFVSELKPRSISDSPRSKREKRDADGAIAKHAERLLNEIERLPEMDRFDLKCRIFFEFDTGRKKLPSFPIDEDHRRDANFSLLELFVAVLASVKDISINRADIRLQTGPDKDKELNFLFVIIRIWKDIGFGKASTGSFKNFVQAVAPIVGLEFGDGLLKRALGYYNE